ncbi:MAG: protein kinase, partial [Lentisphaeraceae bacterium]|nr:protein kinase [Lentisphaeraceae bacterium]
MPESATVHHSANTHIYFQEKNPEGGVRKLVKTYKAKQRFLENEYELCKGLDIPGVRRVYELNSQGPLRHLTLEYIPGCTLANFCRTHDISCELFLEMAIDITEILGKLHNKHIIHKNINSHNILYNPPTKDLTLIDFTLASTYNLNVEQLSKP